MMLNLALLLEGHDATRATNMRGFFRLTTDRTARTTWILQHICHLLALSLLKLTRAYAGAIEVLIP